MKITVIASSSESLEVIRKALEINATQDQFILLKRNNYQLDIERIDLFSTNVLIIDSEQVSKEDLRTITACTRDHINPAVIYATPRSQPDSMTELMQAGVMEVIDYPVVQDQLLDAIRRLRSRSYIASTYHSRGKIFSFISAKGGAGATFIATNFGYTLSKIYKQKVLFVDLHMQFGDALYYLMETAGPSTLSDVINQAGLDSTLISSASTRVSDNFNLLAAPNSPDKAVGINAQHIDNLLTVAIQDYDYVIVDLPKEIESIGMKVLDRSDKIFIIFQPIVPYLRAVTKVLNLFKLLGYEDRKIVTILNRMDKSVTISMNKIEDVIRKPVDYVIPNDFLNASESVNAGIPIQLLKPDTPLAASIKKMAAEIYGVEELDPNDMPWYKKWL